MNICLDLSPVVHRKAGLGTYARRLAENVLAVDADDAFSAFHYGAHPPEPLPDTLAGLPRRVAPVGARTWRLGVGLRYALGRGMDDAFAGALSGIDVFHATEHLLPPLRRAASVFTFHDAIYALFPRHHLPLNRAFLGLMMPRFLRRADAVITISECSKRDAVRLYGIDPERLTVIPEAADASFRPIDDPAELDRVRAAYGLPARYILHVATIEPRKNLPALFEAYRRLLDQPEFADVGLVIGGRTGWMFEPTLARVRELGLEARVVFTGYVPAADAPALFSAAAVFAFPSLYEGFGLPPLEAMSAGVPVVCSNASSLPEVVGDAALMFAPADVGALCAALARVLSDEPLRVELRARGLARAARFSWRETARRTVEVYRRAVRQSRRP